MSELNIAPIARLAQPQNAKSVEQGLPADKASFGQWLSQSLSEVDRLQQESDMSAQKLITGENKDIHGTMISMQKAGIALDLVMEIRNKVIAAYDEIKRMQF